MGICLLKTVENIACAMQFALRWENPTFSFKHGAHNSNVLKKSLSKAAIGTTRNYRKGTQLK
eukprot:5330164-Amphidinium_carterae.1